VQLIKEADTVLWHSSFKSFKFKNPDIAYFQKVTNFYFFYFWGVVIKSESYCKFIFYQYLSTYQYISTP